MASKRSRSKETIGNRILYLESQLAKASSREREAYTLEIQQLRAEMGKIDRGSVGTEQLGAVNEINSDSNLLLQAPENVYMLSGAQALPTLGSRPLSIGTDGKVNFSANNFIGSGINPDTLTETGWYAGFGWTGSLAGQSIGTIEVIKYSDDWIVQYFTLANATPTMQVRARHSGTTWSAWRTFSMDGHTHTLDDVVTTNIGGGVNLNDYVFQGFYHQNNNADAITGVNYPAALAGLLEVRTNSTSLFIYQRYSVFGGGAIYERSFYNGTWDPWIEAVVGSGSAIASSSGLIKIKPTGGTNLTVAANGDVGLNSGAADHRIYGCFPSEFRWFKIVIQYNTASQAGMFIQLIDGATVSTAAEYDHGSASNGASSTFAGATVDNSTSWIWDGGASGHFHNVSVDIMDVNLSGAATFWNGTMMTRRTATPSLTSAAVRGGLHQLGTAYDGLRVFPSTGTGGGRIQIYGYR